MDHYVHDYETLSNCFVAIFIHYKTDETKIFVVHELRDDFNELVTFLEGNVKNKEWHISFNGLAFDSQITHYILEHKKILKQFTPEVIATKLYAYAQKVINKQNDRGFSDYPTWKMKIEQIDLFKMNHFDNMAKLSSLKWIQYSMDWENVLEMPIHHTSTINTMEEIDEIIYYCINDVKSTKRLMEICMNQIILRQTIGSRYNINCYSYSNTKIGSELLLKLYCERTGKDIKEVRNQRTIRDGIIVKDILFPYLEFKSEIFKDFYNLVSNTIIKNTKGDFSHEIKFMGNDFFYGAGGIHQCILPGVYECNDEFIIKDADVASQYPSIAIVNKMYPAHLGIEFYNVYKEDIVDVRLAEKAKKEKGDKAIIEGFKEAANASYGNSNQIHSWLFDSQYTMQTTINGQLSITMLVEELLLTLSNAILLQTNTDGFTLKFKKSEEPMYYEICKAWEIKTKLILEYADYKKMIIRDVNNYIGVYTNGKVKCKGEFEWEDQQNYKPSHLHKNKSFLIIPKAIYAYFINGTKPETYLEQNQNIYDYCGAVKSKGDWWLETRRIVNDVAEKFKYMTLEDKENYLESRKWIQLRPDNWVKQDDNTKFTTEEAFESCIYKEASVEKIKLQKIVRYYISNTGEKIIKVNRDGRIIQVEAGKWRQTICNNITPILNTPFDKLNINTKYYLEKIYKEIENITTISTDNYVQGTLF